MNNVILSSVTGIFFLVLRCSPKNKEFLPEINSVFCQALRLFCIWSFTFHPFASFLSNYWYSMFDVYVETNIQWPKITTSSCTNCSIVSQILSWRFLLADIKELNRSYDTGLICGFWQLLQTMHFDSSMLYSFFIFQCKVMKVNAGKLT